MTMRKHLMIIMALLLAIMFGGSTAIAADKKGAKKKSGTVSSANIFNRLLKKEKMKNAPPAEDGIHDIANDGTHVLQPPLIAYEGLPPSDFGNYVDWVKSLNDNLLKPRYDRFDPGGLGLLEHGFPAALFTAGAV